MGVCAVLSENATGGLGRNTPAASLERSPEPTSALEAALARGGLDAAPPACASCGNTAMDYVPADGFQNRRGEVITFPPMWLCACGAALNV